VERLESYITALRQRCGELPDKRSGSNARYSMADIGLSAFSVFFMQSLSFLAHQRALAKRVHRYRWCEPSSPESRRQRSLDPINPPYRAPINFQPSSVDPK
jgi:hypothetical protein